MTTPFIRRVLFTAFACFVLLIAVSPVLGQTTTLNVQVTRPNGVVVSGATVTAINRDTRQEFTATTNDAGEAVLVIPPGRYDIRVEMFGFERVIKEDVLLTPGASTRETFIMESVSLSDLMMMPPVLVTEPERGESSLALSALPNQNNDLTPAFEVVIGSVTTGSSTFGRIIIDGKGDDQRTARLDGVDFNVLSDMPIGDPAIDALGSFTSPQVGIDLDRLSPKRGPFEARLGPGTGAVSEITSFNSKDRKRDLWIVEVFGQMRNDELNARNFFDYEGRNALRSGRFGFKGGRGLDSKSRTWSFVGYEAARARTERNVYEAVPVDAGQCCASGPLAQFLNGYVPSGTTIVPGASSNADFLVARRRVKTTVNANAFNGRFEFLPYAGKVAADDHRSATLLVFRYTRQGSENLLPDGVTGRRQRQNILFNNLLASLKRKSSDSTTHTFRFGLNQTRARVNVETPSETSPSLSESVISLSGTVAPVGLVGQPATLPVATLGGLVKGIGRGFRVANMSTSFAWDVERLYGAKSRHILVGGIEGRLLRMDLDRSGGTTYSFSNLSGFRAGTTSQITFLSDLSGAAPFTVGTGTRHPEQNYLLGYLQATSQVGPQIADADPTTGKKDMARLSFTYGLRYDYFGAVKERDNRAVLVDPATGNFLSPGAFYKTAKFNFQPRFSFSYRLKDDTKWERTVVRGGVGVYSGVPRTGDFLLPIESDRFSTGITGGSFPSTPSSIINNFITNSETRQFQPLTFARNFLGLERVYKWEAALTQTWQGYNFGILYTGNVGRNLPLANIANKIVSVTTNPDPTKPAIVVRELDIVRNGQVFKPFGEFFFRTSEGRSSYNGMTISLGRNVDATPSDNSWLGLAVRTLSVQYTLSRNVGNTSGTLLSNPFDANADFGNNAAHPTHNFKISGVYYLWLGPEKKGPASLLWGWKIAPSLKLSSGFPFVVRLTRPDVVYVDANGSVFSGPAAGRTAVINTPGGGESGGARVPDLIPGVSPYLRNDLEFLNPAAFAMPAPGKFGNLKRGALRGPSVAQLDLSLRKNLFEVGKRNKPEDPRPISAQFQIDIFNVFNHANFAIPFSTLPSVLGTDALSNQLQPGIPFTRAAAGTFGRLNAADPGRVIQFSFTLRMNSGFTSYTELK